MKKKKLGLLNKTYSLDEAVKILKENSHERFNAAVEIHINLDEPGLKGEVILPHGTGKSLEIAIFDDKIEKELQENKINFDVLVALPKDINRIVKFAKLLGPKGLMPSPKKGTLTDSPEAAVKKLSAGTLNFKSESKFPLLHQTVGRRDFTEKQLRENIMAFLQAIGPKHLKAVFLKTTMSPSIKLQLDSFKKA